jgi:hypothetical protein
LSKNGFVFLQFVAFGHTCNASFFERERLPSLGMLDVMVMVICIVNGFGCVVVSMPVAVTARRPVVSWV